MASLRDIRKRIRSVKSSQKITKAMKLVAASKLKRAQEAIVRARPYAQELGSLLLRVAARAQADAEAGTATLHPLLQLRPPQRVCLVVITSDRGLCGPFNSAVLRRAERFISENADRFAHLEVLTVGRKARDHFRKRGKLRVTDRPNVVSALTYAAAAALADDLVREYSNKALDAVFVLYNEFQSAISQRVVVQDVLPITADHVAEGAPHKAPEEGEVDYIYEPSREAVLATLLPRYVATHLWRALLESVASEHGARMTAMDAATRNARDLTEKLTLQYNRARQATITRELMDIVGGAEALSG